MRRTLGGWVRLLCAGALITVIVTWALRIIELFWKHTLRVEYVSLDESWPVKVRTTWPQTNMILREHSTFGTWTTASFDIFEGHPLYKGKTGFRGSGMSVRESAYVIDFGEFGWPCNGMCAWSEKDVERRTDGSLEWSGGVAFASRWHSRGPLQRVILPFQPRLPGFVLNTIFYAVSLRMIWLVPMLVRRFFWRRRGACGRCGYLLKGIGTGMPCPECGELKR